MSSAPFYPEVHSTTVLAVWHNGQLAVGADGQATMGNAIVKHKVRKLRRLAGGGIIAGFAGATADAFALLEHFEAKLEKHSQQMKRAAIELAKDWRTDRMLRRLEAMLIVARPGEILLLSGTGDVLEPEEQIASIGSGSNYALSAARALKAHASALTAEEIVRASMKIAADICIYTNEHVLIELMDGAESDRKE